jgi:hypothetical protein
MNLGKQIRITEVIIVCTEPIIRNNLFIDIDVKLKKFLSMVSVISF